MTSLHVRAAAILTGDLPPDIRDVIEELVASTRRAAGIVGESTDAARGWSWAWEWFNRLPDTSHPDAARFVSESEARRSKAAPQTAGDLREFDSFSWCGRTVVVVGIEHVDNRLAIQIDEPSLTLSYRPAEQISDGKRGGVW